MSAAPESTVRYRELGPLAEGGMAELFEAEREDGTAVVIKRIRPAFVFDDTYRALFFDEGQVQGCICHPNVVALLDRGEDDRGPFLVFERIFGTDLAIVLENAFASRRPLDLAQVLAIAIPLFDALACVHRACADDGECLDVIHRDISPGNVLLSESGDVKLADFGVAKSALKTQHTVVGEMKGKFAYMAPEQTRGDKVCPKADLFAAGTVLYECLTARQLFDGPSDLDVVQAVRELAVDPPSVHNPEVPPELDALVLSLLQKDPNARPDAADDVAESLREIALNLCLERGHKQHVSRLARANPRVATTHESPRRKTQRVMGAVPAAVVVTESPSRRGLWPAGAVVVVTLVVAGVFAADLLPATEASTSEATPALSSTALPSSTVPALSAAAPPPPTAATNAATTNAATTNAATTAGVRTAEAPAAPAAPSTTAPPTTAPPTTAPPTAAATTAGRETLSAKKTAPVKRTVAPKTDVVTEAQPVVAERAVSARRPFAVVPSEGTKATVAAASPPPAAAPAGFGRLFLAAEPWARVTVDGSPLGQNTPVIGLRLAAGRHVVELENPVYKLKQRVVVEIPVDGDVRRFVDLQK